MTSREYKYHRFNTMMRKGFVYAFRNDYPVDDLDFFFKNFHEFESKAHTEFTSKFLTPEDYSTLTKRYGVINHTVLDVRASDFVRSHIDEMALIVVPPSFSSWKESAGNVQAYDLSQFNETIMAIDNAKPKEFIWHYTTKIYEMFTHHILRMHPYLRDKHPKTGEPLDTE